MVHFDAYLSTSTSNLIQSVVRAIRTFASHVRHCLCQAFMCVHMAVSGVKKYGYGQIRDANQNAILVVSTKAACTFNVCVPCKHVRMWPTCC